MSLKEGMSILILKGMKSQKTIFSNWCLVFIKYLDLNNQGGVTKT